MRTFDVTFFIKYNNSEYHKSDHTLATMSLIDSCLPFPQEIPTLYMDVAEYVVEYGAEYIGENNAEDVAYGMSEVHSGYKKLGMGTQH